MTQLQRFLTRIFLFLAIVVAVCGALFNTIFTAFMANPGLNGLILATLIIGIVYIVRQIASLKHEVAWIDEYRQVGTPTKIDRDPVLLAPMARMLGDDSGTMKLSPLSMRTLLDGIGSRLDESREISRYLIGLLIFLGLLGTFWGLLGTISAISGTIDSLSVDSGDFALMFDSLKKGLEKPLSGMGTAFSSSLFGLAGSVILGFLDLQAGQAQNRFFNDLEDWLSTVTKLSHASAGPALEGGDQSIPAYIGALLEQSADSLDNLQRTISRSESGREDSARALMQLSEKLETLTDQRQAEQDLLVRLVDSQNEMRSVMAQLSDALSHREGGGGLDEASRGHLRNLDVHVKHLAEEVGKSRNQLTDDLRSEFKLLARTLAAAMDRKPGSGDDSPRRSITASDRPSGPDRK